MAISGYGMIISVMLQHIPKIYSDDDLKNKALFMHIVDRLSNEVLFFRQKKDGIRRLGLSTLQKCTAAICVLAYGYALDAVGEYLRLGATTARLCVENFVEEIINLFGDEHLRRPTPADIQRLLHIGELRGFPGMIWSINCMHLEWKNRFRGGCFIWSLDIACVFWTSRYLKWYQCSWSLTCFWWHNKW